MIKKHKRPINKRFLYQINERIAAQQLRVLDAEGKQIGILSKFEALAKARELGLDLVEVAATASPPVARIIDFNKFLYQQEKKKQEEKRKSKVSDTKEVRLGPFMNDHDLEVMAKRAYDFLESGDKVRLVVRFVGRQITHPEFGHQVLRKVIERVSEVSKVEKEARFEGKQLIIILAPERKKPNAKDQNEEGSTQTV